MFKSELSEAFDLFSNKYKKQNQDPYKKSPENFPKHLLT